ncbi:hypothetical protein MD484_g4048, partial [Candolleomyces efflorescens]
MSPTSPLSSASSPLSLGSSGSYFPPPLLIEDTAPPIGPDHEAVSTELDDRLSKAIGGFTGGAYNRLDPTK